MKTPELLGRRLECPCGRTHHITPDELLFAPGAVRQVAAVAARHAAVGQAAVVFDARTAEVAGRDAVEVLAGEGWQVAEVLLDDRPGEGNPVTDPPTGKDVRLRCAGADLIVAVGSGVVSDLGKWAAFELGIPAVTFGTAASMNGYAAANVAGKVEGVKALIRARPPAAVISDPDILAAAPAEMTASGLGDVLAKSVSSADWRLNHLLFGDYYCPRSVSLIAEIEPLYLENPQGVAAGERSAMEGLFDALMLTGMAMTMAETSDPASGGEHLISHTLDMRADATGEPHDLHGRQVGVATILCSELYRRVLAVESPAFAVPDEPVDRVWWGPLAGEVASKFAEKGPRIEAAAGKLAEANAWDDLRAELAAMVRPPEVIADCLARAGAACRAEHLGIPRQQLLAAFTHARQMRGRFTILDLAAMLGLMPAAAEGIVAEWG